MKTIVPTQLIGEMAGHGLSPRTAKRYSDIIVTADRWCSLHDLELETLDAPSTAAYAETLPLSWSTRTALRAALGHYWEVVDRYRPPLRAIRCPPQPQGHCRAMAEDDARILAKSARSRGDRAGLAVCLGLYQGMRRAEIATARWDWFDDEPGWVHVLGKGAKTRRIPRHRRMAALLDEWPRASPWLLPGQRHGPVSPATVSSWLPMVCRDAGVPVVSPHVLRHTYLATTNDQSGDLRSVQHLAGHAKPETTSRYTRATDRKLQAIVDSLDY